MGCGASKDTRLERVDDSVHVMLAHDKKSQQKRGELEPRGYVPRAPHPMLVSKGGISATEEDNNNGVSVPAATAADTKQPDNVLAQ
jgi:hypothetical protein